MGQNKFGYLVQEGRVKYQSPSNIAIVKYWGKTGVQIPVNPSLSFSLRHSLTTTAVSYSFNPDQDKVEFCFSFEKEKSKKFEQKLAVFLDRILERLPWLKHYHLIIESQNTFPHSSGIASSASSYAALALCLGKMHDHITGAQLSIDEISDIARLGSGSACRSVFGGWNVWGQTNLNMGSNLHAVHLDAHIHPSFMSIQDTILIVSKDKKAVSSTAGHQLMDRHPYKEGRVQQANMNTIKLLEILKAGDWDSFVALTESEALSLHGLMMSSTPSYTLLLPNSLKIVQLILKFREQNKIPVCFTIDAGPNIHVLYPAENKKQVQAFIHNDLLAYCAQQSFIHDELGNGPTEIL